LALGRILLAIIARQDIKINTIHSADRRLSPVPRGAGFRGGSDAQDGLLLESSPAGLGLTFCLTRRLWGLYTAPTASRCMSSSLVTSFDGRD
jgi:hypothetical protein